METDKKSLKKMFPNLSKELEGEEGKVTIDSVRADPAEAEKTATEDKFLHYDPNVVDFIRRCDTEAQAQEIITYMQKRAEITEEYACELKEQLKKKGVRSFGPKKQENYYFKQSGLC